MTPDHYATLGVAPTSEDVVIRAAYLALMRRYHPDRNPSPEAAERVRAITAAYAVLSDWDRRTEYDWARSHLPAEKAPAAAAWRWPAPSPTAWFAGAATMILLLVLMIPAPLAVQEQTNRMTNRQSAKAPAAEPAETVIAEQNTDPIAPVPDAGDMVTPIEIVQPVAESALPPAVRDAAPAKPRPQLAKLESRPPSPPKTLARAATPPTAPPKPSFSCRIAKGRGELAVCGNASLAQLDRHLGMLYGQSWGRGDAAKKAALLRTRDGFVARRDACQSDSCIRQAYVGRMREISEIMTKN